MLFTERCEQAIDSGKLHIFKNDLESRLEGYTSTDISGDGSEASVLELKLKALILDLIHFVDVVDQLQKENVRNRNDWIWQNQLRFKMNKHGEIVCVYLTYNISYKTYYPSNTRRYLNVGMDVKKTLCAHWVVSLVARLCSKVYSFLVNYKSTLFSGL